MPWRSKGHGGFHPPRPREARASACACAEREASYTRKLLDRGVARCAKKLGEEAIETVIAAVGEDRGRLIGETADLIYHLLVVLAARGVAFADVEAELARRTQQSGLEEKASRTRRLNRADGATHRRRPLALPHLLAGRVGGKAPRHADDVDVR